MDTNKDTNKNVYQRLAIVKELIVGMELTKEGKNAAINRKVQDKNGRTTSVAYSYFTLESLVPIVTSICTQNGLLANFLLLEDSFGLYGLLTITNIDNPIEKIDIIHRTGISAENKMMNKTQQYGSVSTYSHRYLLQHTFGIVDNELEPDNEKFYQNNNTPSNGNGNKPKTESNGNSKQDKPPSLISESQVRLFWARAKEHGFTKEDVNIALEARGLQSVEDILAPDFNGWLERMRDKANKLKQ